MRWVCLVAVVGVVGCTKNNNGKMHPQELPDGFMSDSCTTAAECDDGDPCTDDACGTDSHCTNTPKDCSAVVDDCNSATCDAKTGDCIGMPKREGMTCSDQFGDTGTCMQGVCSPAPQCNQGFDFLDCTPDFHSAMDDTSTSTNTFDTYKCATDETGPELAFQFFPDSDRVVTATLDSTADLDLIVLDSDTCSDQAACLGAGTTDGSGHETVTFKATAFATYTLVVEGRKGASGPFTLSVDCGSCKPVKDLDCNMSVTGDTGSANATNVSSWGCDSNATGPEETWRLPAGADYTLKLTGMTQDLDLLVADEVSGQCDASCSFNFDTSSIKTGTAPETATFSATGSSPYDVVIASKSATSPYMLEVDCAPSCLGRGSTFDCSTGSDSGRSDDATKSTNRVDAWKCDADTTGREVIYQFTAPNDGDYAFDLFGLTADLDLIVVEGTATACDPTTAACLASSTHHATPGGGGDATGGPEHVSFHGVAGHTYYVAVDGYLGAASPYTLRMTSTACTAYVCTPPAGQSLSCTNKEARGRNDDPTKSKNVVDAWLCQAGTTGAEVVYQFKPAAGTYTVQLDELSADLQLIVLPGTCDPTKGCTAASPLPTPSPSPSPSPSPTPSPSPSPGPQSITFTANGGTYNLIIDGKNGAAGSYHIAVTSGCP